MIGLAFIVAIAMAASTDFDVRGFCADLIDADVAVRERATRDLSEWLVDPERVKALLSDDIYQYAEIQLRVRDAATRTPWAGPSLACVAAEGQGPVADRSVALLEALLLHEAARRVLREDLQDGDSDPSPFAESVVTGLAWPVGNDVPLLHFIEWISRVAEPVKPIVVAPDLDVAATAPIAPAELLPGTAAGILVRVLTARGLECLEVGPVRLVVTAEFSRAYRESTYPVEDPPGELDDSSESAAKVPEDVAAARLLARLLVAADPVGRARLFAALRLPGAADVAIDLERRGYPAVGWFARTPDADVLWARLAASSSVEMRFRTLLELSDRCDLARVLAPQLLASDEAARVRAGCYLAARCRLVELTESLVAALAGPASVEAALALAELHPSSRAFAAQIVAALARGMDRASVRAAIEVLVPLDRAVGVPLAPLLRSEDPGARAVGIALHRLRGVDPFLAPGPRPATPLEWATCAVATAMRPERAVMDVPALLGRLTASHDEGALAIVLTKGREDEWAGSRFDELVAWAVSEASGLGVGAIRCIVAADLVADEDYRAGRLRTLLRRCGGGDARVEIELRELWRSLTEDERASSVRWLRSADVPIHP